jgi:hypothetical protein
MPSLTTVNDGAVVIAAALRAAEEAGHARGVRDAARTTKPAGAA